MAKRKKSGSRKPASHHATGSRKKGTHRRKRNKRALSGFGAVTSAVHGSAKQLLNPLAMVGGLAAGNFIKKQLDKVDALNKEEGIMQYAKPAILVVGGAAVAHFGKDNDVVKYAGYGIAAAGVLSGASKVMKKNVLTDALGGSSEEIGVYTETTEEVRRLMGSANFAPELPALSMDGMGNAFNSDVNTDNIDYALVA